MKKIELFEKIPDGFRLATEEDLPLVNLTLAQAFADYNYPIPSVDVPHSGLLRFYYELGNTCTKNALENGWVLTNDDFSAVMLITPFEKRADYNVNSLYNNLVKNASVESADNLLQIFDYVCKGELQIKIDEGTLFVDMFAVQTPKQGQKVASKLMRQLFAECEKKNCDVYLYTNTERNKDIYNHFGFETALTIHKDDLNSDTYYLLWKCPNKRNKQPKSSVNITSMYPMYFSKKENLDKNVTSFLNLGFERLHHYKYDDNFEGYIFGNDKGSKIDVFTSDLINEPEGMFGMRIGVDNLDNVIKYAKNNDYELMSDVITNKSSKIIFAKTFNSMNCCFVEHIKNNTSTSKEELENLLKN